MEITLTQNEIDGSEYRQIEARAVAGPSVEFIRAVADILEAEAEPDFQPCFGNNGFWQGV
ncbi:MAG: hypothetical protein JWL77_4457 [Chthonomonadaceae bacterium]|nr:hypothetical protein [Chthonomonadaceae bacterium]